MSERSSAPASDLIEHDALARERALEAWLRERGSVLVGFSGGVDSAYLAVLATRLLGPDHVLAVLGRSDSVATEQWEIARRVATEFGVRLEEVATDELSDSDYASNPTNRCYFCKRELWSRLIPIARERGIAHVVDGTNADDLGDWRPGTSAAAEHDVAAPLAEVGMTKAHIRVRSRALGLPTWSQPAAPCLASRLPYGTPVTRERLRAVEAGERALRELGIAGDVRVRHHGDLARVELPAHEVGGWMTGDRMRRLAASVRRAGFERVALDLAGFRSGSLNVLEGVTRR